MPLPTCLPAEGSVASLLVHHLFVVASSTLSMGAGRREVSTVVRITHDDGTGRLVGNGNCASLAMRYARPSGATVSPTVGTRA